MPLTSPLSAPTAIRGGQNLAAAGAAVTLSPTARHFARRWSGGITPALTAQVQNAGGGAGWFTSQLSPGKVADPLGDQIDTWFPTLQRTAAQIYARQASGKQGAWEVAVDLSRWTVARQIHSTRQVKEQMVAFWSNLLHVPLEADPAIFWRNDYDKTIRKYALDTFTNLLLHATTHPAMGLNLNNAESTKDAPNENLGRELLELHTVGVDAGYTEADVKASAKMLTGYRVWVWWPSFKAEYRPKDHYVGPLQIMDFKHKNNLADGRAATTAYLTYLANHPRTANRLARRLCVKFVNESPSDDLVATVARAYLANKTAIRPTLQAMVQHPEFTDARSQGAKVRTPLEDYVGTVRALGITLQRPKSDRSFVNAMHWQYAELGQVPYDWPAPNGFPEVNAAWTSAGRVLTSFALHRTLAAKWWPKEDAVLWTAANLLPTLPATLQQVVDTVSLKVLGETPGPQVSQGIATLLDLPLDATVTESTARGGWFLPSLLASLLDSPIHLHR